MSYSASTTIVPFANLPACASSCGPLYDVNGACVPPNVATASAVVYEQCFCSDSRLAAFSTTTAGPCDAACTADPSGFGSITSWYQSMCSSVQALAADVTTTTNADGSTSTITSSSSKSSGGGGGWYVPAILHHPPSPFARLYLSSHLRRISSHWQWVIFIVVMVVGIAGIWIGAAIWRRHYLRKKDRQYALGKNLAARTGSGQNPYGDATPTRSGSLMHHAVPGQPGMFMPASETAGVGGYEEKPPKSKKRWGF